MIRDPYSLEAEQGVLGAMLIKPELVDILSADLKESDFFFSDNRAVFKSIMDLRSENAGIDFLTVSLRMGPLECGDEPLGYTASLHHNTPSVANARSYAGVVLERSIDRALSTAARTVHEIAESDASAEDKIALAHAEIMAITAGGNDEDTISGRQAIERHVEELERREQLGDQIDGLETGIESLDKAIMGLKPGLYIIAGRPKMGKTTLAMNIADHIAVNCNKQVLVFSIEMSNKQLMDKSLASIGSIPLKSLKSGAAMESHPNELLAASTKIANSGLVLYDRKGVTINRIRSVARRHKMKHGELGAIFVDHIGLVDVDDARASAVQRISEITRQLKLLSAELDCPIIALSQLNRELEKRPNKRPIPSDLRDSGSIEQDADMIMFVYRDEVYNENTEYRGVAEIIIGVARDIEACTVRVRYQGKYSSFTDLTADYEEPEARPARSYAKSSLLD